MAERFHVDAVLAPGTRLALPPRAARHVQVLRLQPGAVIVLFDGTGGQWPARVLRMARQAVEVEVGAHEPLEREPQRSVTLAFGMPANDRMDTLIEKATELGATSLQPLVTERSVLRVAGDRAVRKAAHWQAVAAAACEQCGRNRMPTIAEPATLVAWLGALPPPGTATSRLLLSAPGAAGAAGGAAAQSLQGGGDVLVLSGPEGGLSAAEHAAARSRGFIDHSLGPRVLRADTAPLAALVLLLGSDHA
ncbi:MAG: 16S rRNA (uracil(1498)-N(3))-methyltransferase [Aquabacterium sp.]